MLLTNLGWMIPILYFSESLLRLIGQPEDVAKLAAEYNRVAAYDFFFVFQFEANRKFLQNCGWTKAIAVICAVSSLLHVPW